MHRRDGSAFINSLHIFPVFVKFPGDDRGYSTGLSRLLEEYILPLDALNEVKDSVVDSVTGEGNTGEVNERPVSERTSLLEGDSDRSTGVVPSAYTTEVAVGVTKNKSQPNERRPNDTDRLSFAKAPVLTTLSNGHQYVSSDIPNKVAYIALQFSIIQDLRN